MAEKKNPLGPTGVTAAQNVERLRTAQNLSYAELSRKLDDLGRPIATLGLSRIESQARRIDADDLVALALALGVSPLALLLPHDYEQTAQLTENGTRYPAAQLWEWGSGRRPLSGDIVTFMRDSNPARFRQLTEQAADAAPDSDPEAAAVILADFAERRAYADTVDNGND
ncbi:helix-turn-helix domain-containing protein [Rhodococcus sp. NPDC127530]|uniref:helix-turn-helix domain-containing protein n=1 Tax=unclassified Rhodococcus (in: high G+C Gram-positive bacteria) TaxID=192944 RepID=UPI00363F225A